jgi:hypothetical protein
MSDTKITAVEHYSSAYVHCLNFSEGDVVSRSLRHQTVGKARSVYRNMGERPPLAAIKSHGCAGRKKGKARAYPAGARAYLAAPTMRLHGFDGHMDARCGNSAFSVRRIATWGRKHGLACDSVTPL